MVICISYNFQQKNSKQCEKAEFLSGWPTMGKKSLLMQNIYDSIPIYIEFKSFLAFKFIFVFMFRTAT